MWYMSVTPEVFQLEMSALNSSIRKKSLLMSVIRETSQPAMGPYFFSALARFLLKALTAFFRESLPVKVPGGEGGAAGGAGAGEAQFFSTYLLYLLHFFLQQSTPFLHFFVQLPAASTPVARRSEMRSMIMSFIVCALCVPARAKAMAHDRTRARSTRRRWGERPLTRRAADDAYARQWGSRLGRAWRGVCGLDSLRERVPQRLGGRGCGRASWDGRASARARGRGGGGIGRAEGGAG